MILSREARALLPRGQAIRLLRNAAGMAILYSPPSGVEAVVFSEVQDEQDEQDVQETILAECTSWLPPAGAIDMLFILNDSHNPLCTQWHYRLRGNEEAAAALYNWTFAGVLPLSGGYDDE